MTQYRGGQPNRRPLTPAQRRKILEMRRKRRMRKRLMIIVPVIVLLLVMLLVVILTTGAKKKDVAQTPHLTISPTAQAMEVGADALGTPSPSATAAPTPTVAPNSYASAGNFDYDEAVSYTHLRAHET